MPKPFNYIFVLLIFFKSILVADELFYNDRVIFYVDNKISNFKIEKDNKTVSLND